MSKGRHLVDSLNSVFVCYYPFILFLHSISILSTVILSTADVLIHLHMALPCYPASMCYFHQLIIISITTKSTSSKVGPTSIPSVVKLSITLIYSLNSRILCPKTSFIAVIYLSMSSSVYLIKSMPRSSYISY